MADVSNLDDIIDSRDIIARLDELEDERNAFAEDKARELGWTQDAADFGQWKHAGDAEAAYWDAVDIPAVHPLMASWDDEDELKALRALADEADGVDDWHHGATLVRDSYFTRYAQEMLEDCGDIPRDMPDYIEIDWDATARNIQVDYTSVEFDGVTYWVR